MVSTWKTLATSLLEAGRCESRDRVRIGPGRENFGGRGDDMKMSLWPTTRCQLAAAAGIVLDDGSI